MEPGGKISVRLGWDGARIARVSVVPRDSVAPAKLLSGKGGQQAVNLIPMLFSLCGKAQGVAGAMALEAATDVAPPRETALWRDRLVQTEAIQESLWRILLDLPVAVGREPMTAQYVELRRHVARGLAGLLGADAWKTAGGCVAPPSAQAWTAMADDVARLISEQVFGAPLDAWLDARAEGLAAWLEAAATPISAALRELRRSGGVLADERVPFLPQMAGGDVLREVVPQLEADEGFCRCPLWHGVPAETGPLARMAGHPLLAGLAARGGGVLVRVLARLVEIATLSLGLNAAEAGLSWLGSAQVRPGTGVAWVQTARGLLVHLLRLEQGMVADYRILAPTEWNFHPTGAYVRGLAGSPAATRDEAKAAAQRLLLALDPCVAYEIEVDDA